MYVGVCMYTTTHYIVTHALYIYSHSAIVEHDSSRKHEHIKVSASYISRNLMNASFLSVVKVEYEL